MNIGINLESWICSTRGWAEDRRQVAAGKADEAAGKAPGMAVAGIGCRD